MDGRTIRYENLYEGTDTSALYLIVPSILLRRTTVRLCLEFAFGVSLWLKFMIEKGQDSISEVFDTWYLYSGFVKLIRFQWIPDRIHFTNNLARGGLMGIESILDIERSLLVM